MLGGSEFANADFDDTLFGADVSFADVTFTGEYSCHGAHVRTDVSEPHRIWPIGWHVVEPPTPEQGILPKFEGRWARLFAR